MDSSLSRVSSSSLPRDISARNSLSSWLRFCGNDETSDCTARTMRVKRSALKGVVSAVSTVGGEIVLSVNGVSLRLKDVTAVRAPVTASRSGSDEQAADDGSTDDEAPA